MNRFPVAAHREFYDLLDFDDEWEGNIGAGMPIPNEPKPYCDWRRPSVSSVCIGGRRLSLWRRDAVDCEGVGVIVDVSSRCLRDQRDDFDFGVA